MKVKKGLVGGSPGAVLVLVKTPSSGEDCGDDGDGDYDDDDDDDEFTMARSKAHL